MESKFKNNISELTSSNQDKRVLVGVSGGADSVVLAYLLHSFGFQIALAHCHFNLRGKDADADQEFTKNLALQFNVPFYTIKFETETYAKTRKISIQMAARNLRYFWFEKICKENNFSQIAVGTHLTDNIETFLLNSTRGTGLSGLRGIKPINGRIIRPLLGFTKEEIYSYSKSKNLDWREDLSNQSIKYHRNKIRHTVLPILKELNPNLEDTFQRNFKRLLRVDAYVQEKLDETWNDWVTHTEKGFSLPIDKLRSDKFTDVILTYKLQPFGFNPSQVHDLITGLSSQPGVTISSTDYKIYVDRTEVFVQPKRFFTIPNEYSITEFLGEITQPIPLKFEDHHRKDVSFSKAKNIAYFDFDTLTYPLTLRVWKEGDRIHPFGMKGSKKVSDLLIDAKIPLPEKENIWVLESNQKICWVIGIRSSEQFKVTDQTKRIFQVTAF
tara:strand:- start:11305 stop:12627 length:1323 start_codon:yes stop_codon:yes gene_type:complete